MIRVRASQRRTGGRSISGRGSHPEAGLQGWRRLELWLDLQYDGQSVELDYEQWTVVGQASRPTASLLFDR
jgi:hypothetical protein